MGNNVINLFKNKLFSTTTLTDEINDRDMVPDQVSSRVPFAEKAIITTSAMVAKKGGTLSLIPFSPRGAPGMEIVGNKREGVPFDSRQIKQEFTITADECQDVLLFGSMGERLEALQDKMRELMWDADDNLAATIEYHKLGTLMGQIRDADGVTVVENLFSKFDVAQFPTVGFNLAANVAGQLREKCSSVIRQTRAGAQARIDGVGCFCGKNVMDLLYKHQDVEKGYTYFLNNARLRDRAAFVALDYGGIQFEEYAGYTENLQFVGDDDMYFYPLQTSGANPGNGAESASSLFQVRWTPAPFFSRLNQPGIPRYIRVFFEPGSDPSWVKVEISSYPILFCRKPKALIKGVKN